MARRILNRKDLRADYEAAERRRQEDEVEGEDEGDDEEEEEEAQTDAEAGDEEAAEEAPKKPKKPAKETKAKPRSRSAKVVRMKVVWGVFNNSNQMVKTFDYPRKKDAEEHAAHMQSEKKQTFFVQPVRQPIEEKKE